jgi:pyruvate dehydrogenase (quinone)
MSAPPGSGRWHTAKAILKGDENARSVIVEGIKTKVQEFLPHSGE